MAPHPLTLHLDPDTARMLGEAAEAAGVAPERMAEALLAAAIDRGTAPPDLSGVREPTQAWGPREPFAHPGDYDGPYTDLDEALDAFDVELKRRLASRAD